MTEIIFRFPVLPESVNHLYFTRGKRRVMTTAGRKFLNAFVSQHGGVSPAVLMQFPVDHEACYELQLWFILKRENIFNETYGTDRRVKSPFKDIDASNMIKLAEDSIAQLLGLRDRNNWTTCAHKRLSRDGSEGTIARLRLLNLYEDPFPCPP